MIGRVDIEFIRNTTPEKDVNLFLNPKSEGQERIIMNFENKLLAHLMKEAGIFSSVSEARKNGWNRPIPTGYNEFVIGKKKSLVTILNIPRESNV
jgi:hypothetical protein